jgi:hypothetical protein
MENLYKKASSTCMWGQQGTQQLLCPISVLESEGDKEARFKRNLKLPYCTSLVDCCCIISTTVEKYELSDLPALIQPGIILLVR